MEDGFPTPKAMDGMATFAAPNGNIILVRNHEDGQAGNTPAAEACGQHVDECRDPERSTWDALRSAGVCVRSSSRRAAQSRSRSSRTASAIS